MRSDPYVSFLLYNVFAMYAQYGDSHSISIAYDCFFECRLAQKPSPLRGYIVALLRRYVLPSFQCCSISSLQTSVILGSLSIFKASFRLLTAVISRVGLQIADSQDSRFDVHDSSLTKLTAAAPEHKGRTFAVTCNYVL